MPSIQSIYDRYPVTKNLTRHMLRVAAVVQKITENWKGPALKKGSMIRIALLHDMGNILKFDLDDQPHLLMEEENDIEKWRTLQNEWSMRFDTDEDQMTYAIARECGLTEDEIVMMTDIGFGFMNSIAAEPDFERKVIKYADMRVGPFGVLSLTERLDEARKRYDTHPTANIDKTRTERLEKSALQVEKQVMQYCTIKPENIAEEFIRDDMEKLRSYSI